MAEQALAELAPEQEVDVLLERQPVAACELAHARLDAVGESSRPQLGDLHLGHEREPVRCGMRGEVGEPDRRHLVGEVVVHERARRPVQQPRQLAREHPAVRVRGVGAQLGQHAEQLARASARATPGSAARAWKRPISRSMRRK